MMKYLFFNLSIAFSISLFSCSKVSEKKPGDWDDNIKLSTRNVVFNASADSVTIKTEGSWWGISDISVDNKYFTHFDSIKISNDTYSIKHDCFVVERRDKNTLFIKVSENPLHTQRVIGVGLTAGDYFDRVKITQKSK